MTADKMPIGTVEKIKGRCGAFSSDTELHVYARTAQYHTEIFTHKRDGQELPLFSIRLGGIQWGASVGTLSVSAPYVMTQDGSGKRVDCENCPEFWCAVPEKMLPTSKVGAALYYADTDPDSDN